VVRAGLKPVFVDSDPRTWNMVIDQVKAKINSRTKAVMPVHIYGLPVDMDPLLDLAKTHDLAIIEDAAEVIGQTYNGKPCGSFGDLSTVSFYPNKHVTTGEGGMVLTDDPELAERCRSLRNLCFKPPRRFVHDELGFNYRMTNLQASLGLAQLERLDEFVQRKRKIGNLYQELLAGAPGLELPVKSQSFAENIYWVFGIVLADSVPYDAEAAMQKLAAVKVGTRPFFWPMHEQPVFARMGLLDGEPLPVAERIARRGFYLPSGLTLTEADIREVAGRVRETLK
jgi:perosamine synthetase